jgi:hypothetical protein
MKKCPSYLRPLLVIMILINSTALYSQSAGKLELAARSRLKSWKNPLKEWQHIARPKLDSLKVDQGKRLISIYFASTLSYYPFREESFRLFRESLAKPWDANSESTISK